MSEDVAEWKEYGLKMLTSKIVEMFQFCKRVVVCRL